MSLPNVTLSKQNRPDRISSFSPSTQLTLHSSSDDGKKVPILGFGTGTGKNNLTMRRIPGHLLTFLHSSRSAHFGKDAEKVVEVAYGVGYHHIGEYRWTAIIGQHLILSLLITLSRYRRGKHQQLTALRPEVAISCLRCFNLLLSLHLPR